MPRIEIEVTEITTITTRTVRRGVAHIYVPRLTQVAFIPELASELDIAGDLTVKWAPDSKTDMPHERTETTFEYKGPEIT